MLINRVKTTSFNHKHSTRYSHDSAKLTNNSTTFYSKIKNHKAYSNHNSFTLQLNSEHTSDSKTQLILCTNSTLIINTQL